MKPRREEGKGLTKKGEAMATFGKTKSKPINSENFN